MNLTNYVEKYMTLYPSIANVETKAVVALQMMKSGNFRHLPVLDGRKIVGVVSERDLLRVQSLLESVNPTLSEIMTQNPYIVRVGTTLADVTKEMAKHKYGCAIIVNEKEGVVGIFTTVDALILLNRLIESDSKIPTKGLGDKAIKEYFEWTSESECLG